MLDADEIAQPGDVGEDGVIRAVNANQSLPHLPDICMALMERAVQRNAMIRGQQRLELAAQSLAARACGWQPDLPKAQRKKIRAKAERLVRQIAKGKTPEDADAARRVGGEIMALMLAKQPLTQQRELHENVMRNFAKQTPGAALVEQVKGFGYLGLASIVGEAGDLSNYPHWKHLRKRLGWAPKAAYPKAKDVYATSDKDGRLRPRSRQGRIYGDVQGPLMKYNGPTSETRYRQQFDATKAVYLERGWNAKHANTAAQRRMLQLLLKDLWQTWKERA